MKIAVTKKHIKDGDAGNENSCAIALAIADSLKALGLRSVDVTVDGESASVSFNAPFNKTALAFVEGFDMVDEPDPIDFDEGEDDKEYKTAKKEYDKKRAKVRPFEFELKN